MADTELFSRWKEGQSHWDDDEFLASLHSLMRLRYKRLNKRVAKILTEAFGSLRNPRLLDIGCGRGDFGAFLESLGLGAGWTYFGLEPSAEQLAHRVSCGLPRHLVQGAAERLPFVDMSMDGVLLKEMLDHCWDPGAVFRECYRVLKPGGFLVVTLTNDRSWFKRLLPGVNRRLKSTQHDHLHFFGPDELAQAVSVARFDTPQLQTYNHLKLPRFLEKATAFLGPLGQDALLEAGDALGRVLAPDSGGGMLLKARRPLEN